MRPLMRPLLPLALVAMLTACASDNGLVFLDEHAPYNASPPSPLCATESNMYSPPLTTGRDSRVHNAAGEFPAAGCNGVAHGTPPTERMTVDFKRRHDDGDP